MPPSYESGRPPAVPPAVPGGIRIGVMAGGAAASGPHARALDASTQLIDASPELLAAVGTLREQLHLLSPSDETTEVDAQLAETEEEIDAVGQVGAAACSGCASASISAPLPRPASPPPRPSCSRSRNSSEVRGSRRGPVG